MGNRRRARVMALQTLYSLEFGHRTVPDALMDMRARAAEPPSEDEDLSQLIRGDTDAQDFAETLVKGVMENQDVIDELVSQCSTNWKITRMAMVDRNILRMAAYELQHLQDIPPRVSLNEAVELAKRYGTKDSSAFVNGILDRIASMVPDPS